MAPAIWLGLQVALAWFFTISIVAALTVIAFQGAVRRQVLASGTARVAFGVRLIPAAVAITMAGGLVVPAFVWLEPSDTGEYAGWVVRLLAAGGAGLLVFAVVRGVSRVKRSSRALKAHLGRSVRLPGVHGRVAAFSVDSPQPMLLLSGIIRPRLFVSESVLGVLTREELKVSIRHELAHFRARDNLKRLVLAFLPDLVGSSRVARMLEHHWHRAAECDADAAATAGSRRDAVTLAGALVKVARLRAGMPAQAAHCAALDDGPIADRVTRLLSANEGTRDADRRGITWLGIAAAAVFGSWAFAALPSVLRMTHQVSEFLVGLP